MAQIVKDRLSRNRLTQNWLICQLEKEGIITCKQELSNALHGIRKGEKVERIIEKSNTILDKYEEVFK